MKKIEVALFALLIGLICTAAFIGYTATPGPSRAIEFNAPALFIDGSGTLGAFKMTLAPGNGKTLVNIENAAFLTDVENSLRKAKANAEQITGVKLKYYDVILEAKHVDVVSGESAGAVLTAAIVALATNHDLDSKTTGSAGITIDGKVFPVDGIEEKILAAKSAGKKTFIVANAQEIKNVNNLPKDVKIIKVETTKDAVLKMLV